MAKNLFNWVEIAVTDFERAKSFYEKILDCTIEKLEFGGEVMGLLPYDEGGSSGAIVFGEPYKPSRDGAIIYFNGDPDLQVIQDRIEPAGGQIIQAKKQISPEHGYMALFLDTEGNRLALHSQG